MQSSSLVHPEKNRFNVRLRIAMRTRINVILQRNLTAMTDATRKRKFLPDILNYTETRLMNLAKSEEEYSNLRDLEVRVHYLMEEFLGWGSRLRRMSVSEGINALPDTLITQILLWLPTKDSVRTSVLSKRWRNLWLEVPGLELHSNDFPKSCSSTNNFIHRFLEFNRQSRLKQFKIKYYQCNACCLFGSSKLIAEVINRGVHHLDVEILKCPLTEVLMPVDIYKSKTLVSLKLANVRMANPEFVVSLPCLKTMHLENLMGYYENHLVVKKLLSGCPVLEDLTVCRAFLDDVPVLRVRSQSLKRLCVKFGSYRYGHAEYAVEIDAPGLKYMSFRDEQSDRVVVKNLSSLFMIDIDTKFNVVGFISQMKIDVINNFFSGVSSARHMIISHPTLAVLYPSLKLEPFTIFRNLSRLEASFCTVLLQVLPNFLTRFPNLKHLTLHLLYLKDLEPENLKLTIVPWCLLYTLECVEIKEVITVEKAGTKRGRSSKGSKVSKHKKKIWIGAVRYILENSSVLKKLVLCFSPLTNKVLGISEALPSLKKRYPSCEIFNHLKSL